MAGERQSFMDWIRTVRFGWGSLLGFALVLMGLFALFHYTDLWYVLFP